MADDRLSIANIPVVYTNSVRLALSFADFRLFMGEALPSGPIQPAGNPPVLSATAVDQVDRVCIVISPDIIPQLIKGLETAVDAYQKAFGPLRTLPNIPQVTVATTAPATATVTKP
jgi:hypothetical protein